MKRMKFVWHALTSSVVAWMGTVTIAGPVLPPWPEGALKHWRFNAAAEFASERTAPLDHAGVLSVESWSGWALQVAGASPAVIRFPGRDATGRPNLTLDQGSVRFWFRPDWNSGAGPGVAAPLFEVAAVSGRLWSGWSLEVSADGSRLGLVVQGNAVGEEWLLETPIGWLAGRWHEVVVSYAAEATALYVDGLLVARGEGLRLGSVTVGDADVGFSLGSDVASGTRLAQGQFEELSTYDYVYPAEGVARRYRALARAAGTTAPERLGPESGGIGGGELMSLSSPSPPGGGGGTGGPAPGTNAYAVPGLKLTIPVFTNGQIYLTIFEHNPAWPYDLYARTSLSPTNATPGLWQWAAGLPAGTTNAWLPDSYGAEAWFVAGSAADEDADGLTDGAEWWIWRTNPQSADSDGDGTKDGAEVVLGRDPLAGWAADTNGVVGLETKVWRR